MSDRREQKIPRRNKAANTQRFADRSRARASQVAAGGGAAEAEAALRAENATSGDVVQVAGLRDAATNVSAKLLASLSYFAAGGATHFVRVEDDVYLFADRLAFTLCHEPGRGSPRNAREASTNMPVRLHIPSSRP